MFSGIVETMGRVSKITNDGTVCTLTISAPQIASEVAVSDSVAVN